MIEYLDLLIVEDDLAQSAITGEEPEGPGNKDNFFYLAELACASVFVP